MYNYADDNTLSKFDKTLEEDGKSLINCFFANKMHASSEPFQAISDGRKTHDTNISFSLNGTDISSEDEENY